MRADVTLYQLADSEIRRCIASYLQLLRETRGFSNVEERNVVDQRSRVILLAGLGVRNFNIEPSQAVEEWKRRAAVPFDIEAAITTEVYRHTRELGSEFLNSVDKISDGFKKFDPTFIQQNPYLLPILQHLGGIFSKSKLKSLVGSVSDASISKPAAQRLATLLSERVDPKTVNKGEVLQRLEGTLEGIVRDLVGRVLLESIVTSALQEKRIPFQREADYSSLKGVVYDFRADFVLPNSDSPLAFVEVRKSSSRHASLYAKDKMFSAINWKGKNPKLLAVLVVDGEWTKETLLVLAKVFDYVVPISRVPELADTLRAYLDGDDSKLKWLIEFRIDRYDPTTKK
jgi:hypothetical protein